MNEEQKRELIEKYGFHYIPGVGIIDSNDILVTELNIEGQIFTSEMSPEEYARIFQKERLSPREDIIKMRDNPFLYTKEKFQEEKYKKAYAEIAEEDRQKTGSSWTSPEEEFEERRTENNPLISFLTSEDEQNRLLFLDQKIKEIEDIDPDNITESEKNEEEFNAEIDSTDPLDFSHDMGLSVMKGISGFGRDIYRAFQDVGDGMKDEELKREYQSLISERNNLLKPAAQRLKEQLEKKEQDLSDRGVLSGKEYLTLDRILEDSPLRKYRKASGISDEEWNSKDLSEQISLNKEFEEQLRLELSNKRKIKGIINNLDDFIEGKNYDSNIFSQNNADDWLTVGIAPALELYALDVPLINKISKEGFDYNSLTQAEKDRLELMNLEADVNNQDLNYSGWRHFSQGLNETGKFMASTMTTGGLVAKVGTKAVTKGTRKIVDDAVRNAVNESLSGTAYVLGQSLGSASTYKYMAENYMGEIQPIYDKDNNFQGFAARERAYNILSDEIDNALDSIKDSSFREEDPEKLRELSSLEETLIQQKKSLKKPPSVARSIGYGLTENIIEHAAERFGGRLLPKFTPKGDRMKRALEKVSKTKFGDFYDKSNKKFNKFLRERAGFNNGNLIGGIGEEYYEELLVQAAYNPWDDQSYSEKISQLSELDFHLDVLAQTLAIKGGSVAAGAVLNNRNIPNQVKAARKELREIEKNLKKKNISQSSVQGELIKLGVNPKLTPQEYNNAIHKEKDPEKKRQILTEAYKDKVDNALLTNSLDDLKSTLSTAHTKIEDPQHGAAIASTLQYIDKVKEYKNEYRNASEVARLSRSLEAAEEGVDRLSEKRAGEYAKVQEDFAKLVEEYPGEEVVTQETFSDNPKFMEYLETKELSQDMNQFLQTTNHKKVKQEVVDAARAKMKTITSFDYQSRLDDMFDYRKKLLTLNLRNPNLTKSELQEKFNEVDSSDLPASYASLVEKNVLAQVEDMEIAQEPAPAEPPSERAMDLAEALTETEVNDPAKVRRHLSDLPPDDNPSGIPPDESDLPPSDAPEDDFFDASELNELDFSPSSSSLSKFKEWVNTFQFTEGRMPEIVDALEDLKSLNMKGSELYDFAESLFNLWESPGGMNQKIDRTNLFNAHIIGRSNILAQALSSDPNKLTKQESEPVKVETIDDTGLPVVKEFDQGTQYLDGKVAYKAVDSKFSREVFKDENGNKYVKSGIEDREDPETVQLVQDPIINHQALKDPNRTQIGDNLTTHPVEDRALWDKIPTTVRDEGGLPISPEGYTFGDWVRDNIGNMPFDDFRQTQAYKNKVPILLRNKHGEDVGYVPDVTYYTPYTVKDSNVEPGDKVFIYDPTESHKEIIEKAKEEARETRDNILGGNINYLTISNISASPSYYILDPKPIADEFKNNKVVFFNGYSLQDLAGNEVDARIKNLDSLRGKGDSVFGVLSPIMKQEDGEIEYELLYTRPNNRPETVQEDLDTVRFMIAAQNTLKGKTTSSSGYRLDQNEAEIVNDFVIQQYGFSLSSENSYNKIQEEAYKMMLTTVEDDGTLNPTMSSIWKDEVKRQTFIKLGGKTPVRISYGENGLTLETPWESYEDYVKNRRTIAVRGFEVGTQEKPVQTHQSQTVVHTVSGSGTIASREKTSEPEFEAILPKDESDLDREVENLIGLDWGEEDLSPAPISDPDLISQSMGYIKHLSFSEQTSAQEEMKKQILSGLSRKDIRKELNKTLAPTKRKLEELRDKYESEKKKAILKREISKINVINDFFDDIYEEAAEDLRQRRLDPEEQELYEKDYNKSSSEIIHKEKLSQSLRKLMIGLETGEKTVGGLTKREFTFDSIYNTVFTRIIESFPPDPSWSDMKLKMEEISDDYDWMEDLIMKLDANKDLQNQFVTHGYKFLAKAVFVNMSDNRGVIKANVLQSNSAEVKQMLRDEFDTNLKAAPLTQGGILNRKIAKQLAADYNKIKNDPKKARKWLMDFGISLSDKTWENIQKRGLRYWSAGKVIRTNYKNLFNEKNPSALFSALNQFVTRVAEASTDIPFGNTEQNNPLRYVFTALKGLINEEAKQRHDLISVTRYSGGKTLSEMEMPSYFFEKMKDLKRGGDYVENLRGDHFSESSIVLEMLEDQKVNEEFNYFTLDNNSLKINKLNKGRVDKLSPKEHAKLFRALSQESPDKRKKLDDKYGVAWRLAKMPTLTNSDKGRVMLVNMPVVDIIQDPSLLQLDDNKELVAFRKELQEVIYRTFVTPELNRILKSKKQNINNYNNASKVFTIFPFLNQISVDGEIAYDYLQRKDATAEGFRTKYYNKIQNAFIKFIQSEVNQNQTVTQNKQGKTVVKNLSNLNFVKNSSQKEVAEFDYVLNSMFANVNVMQLISGDPALYSKARLQNNDFLGLSRAIDIEMGKRMAAMIAPGIVGNNALEKYIQLAISDDIEEADSILEIVKIFHKVSKKHEKLIKKKDKTEKEIEYLQDKFPKVAGYFDIKTTDAQEYTTISEHLKILRNYGKISEKEYKEISDYVKDGNFITDNPAYSSLVFQPIKPVYTGEVFRDGVKQFIYIKSSSFPLLPEVHREGRLSGLLEKMEDLEQRNPGLTVRASYQTANKIGAPLTTLSVDNINRTSDVSDSMTILDRKNFKIQQEIPNKSAKEGDDRIIRGSQLFKLMFGNDVTSIPEGKELHEDFKSLYNNYMNNKRKELLLELDMDENYNPLTSDKETAKKIQNLLINEAKERGLSPEDIKALGKLTRTPNGITIKTPMYLMGDSEKLETMLNAVIKNRIFVQKWPGVSFVAGSEAGFRFKEGVPKGIIPVGDYNGEPLKDNQILVPPRFKYNGKLIDLTDPKYLDKDGRLRKDMIDTNLLNHITYRIPTSSHASAASVKVVGFLPAHMGDVIIASKNLITQMGQDFDVDKLYTYGYHHIIKSDGSIKQLSVANKKEWLENNGYKSLESKEKAELLFEIALQENQMIDIYNAVYNLPAMQKRVKKQLSTSNLEKHAEDLDNILQNKSLGWSFASGNHQMDKIFKASSGATAIGIYAKTATLISLAQQSEAKPVIRNPKTGVLQKFTLGGVTYGELGKIKSSDGQDIADVIDQKIQTAVDDEKVQVLRRVNLISTKALGVDALLTALGINNVIENGEEYNIPYLLHNHPIIKEYLVNPFDPKWKAIADEDMSNFDKITGYNLHQALKKNPRNSKGYLDPVAYQALSLYLKLVKTSSTLVESNLLLDASEFGLTANDRASMFFGLVHLDQLPITNIDKFFGEVNSDGEGIFIGKYNNLDMYFKPASIQATVIGQAVSAGRNLFEDLFPVYDERMYKTFETISTYTNKAVNPLKEFKAYVLSSPKHLMFEGTATDERVRLLNKGPNSFARYLSSLMYRPQDKDVNIIKNNKFMKALQFSFNNENYDLVNFRNNTNTTNGKRNFTNALRDLIVKDVSLPDFQGKSYTSRMLVQDLISYSHITAGISNRVDGFHNLIPYEYYEAMQVEVNGKKYSSADIRTQFMPHSSLWQSNEFWDNFITQVAQQNASKVNYVGYKELQNLLTEPDSKLPKILRTHENGEEVLKMLQPGTRTYLNIPQVNISSFPQYDIAQNYVKAASSIPRKISTKNENFSTASEDIPKILSQVSGNTKRADFAAFVLENFAQEIKEIKVINVDDPTFEGRYYDNTIEISTAAVDLEGTFMHELGHGITVEALKPYFTTENGVINWEKPKASAPESVLKLYGLLQDYRKKAGNPSLIAGKTELTEEDRIIYAGKNIKEFIAAVFEQRPSVVKFMNETMYRSTKTSFKEKFKEIFDQLMSFIAGKDVTFSDLLVPLVMDVVVDINPGKSNQQSLVDIGQRGNFDTPLSEEEIEGATTEDPSNFEATDFSPPEGLPDIGRTSKKCK